VPLPSSLNPLALIFDLIFDCGRCAIRIAPSYTTSSAGDIFASTVDAYLGTLEVATRRRAEGDARNQLSLKSKPANTLHK